MLVAVNRLCPPFQNSLSVFFAGLSLLFGFLSGHSVFFGLGDEPPHRDWFARYKFFSG